MVVGGIRQMLSLSPENVNNGRATFRTFGFHVCAMFLWLCTDGECENVKDSQGTSCNPPVNININTQ